MEGVLRHVGDAQVGVLPHHACCGLSLASQHLDQGRLAGSVGTDAGHAGGQGHLGGGGRGGAEQTGEIGGKAKKVGTDAGHAGGQRHLGGETKQTGEHCKTTKLGRTA
jgi:hypothetical protein